MVGDRQADAEIEAFLEENVDDLYENAPVGLLSTLPDGTIVKVNATLLAWTGHARDDLVGRKRLHDLLAPGGRIYYETHYAPLLQMQGTVREIALEVVRADGSRLPVLLNSLLLRDERGEPRVVRTTLFDATERRRYERELLRARTEAETRGRAALALAHVSEAVLLVSPAGRLDVLNAAAERLLGLDAATALGRPLTVVVPEWDVVAERTPVGRPDGPTATATVPLARAGRELWLEVAAVDSGDGVVYTLRDVTAEHALEQLRSDLVTIVSHELRTPLTGSYGAAQTLVARGDELTPEMRRSLLELIVEQNARLTQIVDDVLLTSRLDTGNLPVETTTFDATAVAERLVSKLGRTTRDPRLVLDAEPELHACGDPDKTEQVLTNLLENALKYTDGVVRLTVERDASCVRFTVADEGPGIPPSEHERVFEKFYRLDPDQRGGVGGTGLGLYIARELVARMRGRIFLLPRDRGAAFAVELPLA